MKVERKETRAEELKVVEKWGGARAGWWVDWQHKNNSQCACRGTQATQAERDEQQVKLAAATHCHKHLRQRTLRAIHVEAPILSAA